MKLNPANFQRRLNALAANAGLSRSGLMAVAGKLQFILNKTADFRRANYHRRLWKLVTSSMGLTLIANFVVFFIKFDVEELAHELTIHGLVFAVVVAIGLISSGRWRHWTNIRREVQRELETELGVDYGRAVYRQLKATGEPLPEE